MSAASFYDPRESHPTPYFLRRPSSGSWEVWPRLLQSHCFCSQSSCVHPPRVEFLFSSVLRSSCNQAPLAFKAKCSADSSLRCQTPRLESLGWAQSSHSFGRTSVIWLFPCLWVTHQRGMEFDYIMIMSVPLLSSYCGFFFISLSVEYLFWWAPAFLLMVVQLLAVISVCLWEEMSSGFFCSVLLSPVLRVWGEKNFYLKTWHITGIWLLVAAAVIQILKWGEELILRIF